MEDIKIVLQELDKSIAESMAFVEEDCGGLEQNQKDKAEQVLREDGFIQGLLKAKSLIQACG